MNTHLEIIKKYQDRIEEIWLNRIYGICANAMEGANYGDFIIAQTGDVIFREMIKKKGYKLIPFGELGETYKKLEQDIEKELNECYKKLEKDIVKDINKERAKDKK